VRDGWRLRAANQVSTLEGTTVTGAHQLLIHLSGHQLNQRASLAITDRKFAVDQKQSTGQTYCQMDHLQQQRPIKALQIWSRFSTSKGETDMSKIENNRVLSRMAARELTQQEIEEVSGAIIRPKCTFDPRTCFIDGMCSPEPAC